MHDYFTRAKNPSLAPSYGVPGDLYGRNHAAFLLDRTLDLLATLIAFDTHSSQSNLALIGFVRGHLAEHGVESHARVRRHRQQGELYATIGPADRPGLCLSGLSGRRARDRSAVDGASRSR